MYIKDTTLLKKVPENSTPESYLYKFYKKVSGNNEKDKILTIRSVSKINAGRFFSGEIGSFKKNSSTSIVDYYNIKGDQVNHNFNDNDLIYVYYSPGVYTNISRILTIE